MNNSYGFIVSSREEQTRIQVLRPEAPVLVLSFPLFAPDPAKYIGGKSKSKTNQIPVSEITLKSFEFKYKEQLEDFLGSCDSFIAIAPNTQDGKQWLAHAYHMGKLFIEPDAGFACGLYTYLGDTAITPKCLVCPDLAVLDTDFYKYVFGYITAAWFRSYVLAPFHQKVAHIGKGALSLGGCYTLLTIASVENRYHLGVASPIEGTSAHAHVTLPVQMLQELGANKQITTAPVLPNLTVEQSQIVSEEVITSVILPDALEFQDAAVDDYAEAWCIMQEQPNTWAKHVHSGTIAIITQDPVFLTQLHEAIHDTRSLLTSYGLKLHESESQQLSYINAISSIAHFPLVVSSNTGDDADLLMNHLREQMFRAYFTPDPNRHARYIHTEPVATTSQSSLQENSIVAAVECPETVNDYLSLLGTYGFVTDTDTDTSTGTGTISNRTVSKPICTVEHDPAWLLTLLSVLAGLGIRSSYAIYLLHSLQRRKMLCRVNQRFELSSYGYAYAMSLMHFMSAISETWPELQTQFNRDIERSSDRRRTLESALAEALSLMQPVRAAASKFEFKKKQIKKTGSDKKITWTLHLDNKEHVAYWTTRSGKRRAIWYKVTGKTDTEPSMVDTDLDMFPKARRHTVLIPRCCCACGCTVSRLSDTDGTGILTVTCIACGDTSKYLSIPIIKEFKNGKG